MTKKSIYSISGASGALTGIGLANIARFANLSISMRVLLAGAAGGLTAWLLGKALTAANPSAVKDAAGGQG